MLPQTTGGVDYASFKDIMQLLKSIWGHPDGVQTLLSSKNQGDKLAAAVFSFSREPTLQTRSVRSAILAHGTTVTCNSAQLHLPQQVLGCVQISDDVQRAGFEPALALKGA